MAKKKVSKSHKLAVVENDDTRASLMNAAKSLFGSRGFDGTTVKEISDKAGVNISLVSYHFQGKEGLYRSCLEQFGMHRLEVAERMLQPAQTIEEFRLRLEMFFEDIMMWFEQEPELCQMIQRETDLGLPVAEDVFKNTFMKVFEAFYSFIKAGQSKKYLRADLDPFIVAGMIFSGIVHSTRKKKDMAEKHFGISQDSPAYKKKMKTQYVSMLIEGLQLQEKKT